MKTKLIAVALFAATAAAVAFHPGYRNVGAVTAVDPPVDPVAQHRSRIEVVFVLDTTGSMGGLIEAAKEKIWSIASTMASAQPAPEIRMGLVAFRDRGDVYVTRTVDLSHDLDRVYAALMDFQADGGGDTPESVNQALYEAVHHMSWSQDQGAYKVLFLVGDSPPKMGYQDDVKYPETVAAALEKGIVINAIQCGQHPMTTRYWQHVASLGHGEFFQVEQAGGAVAIATPFDEKLAELSARLDETRLYYGTEEQREERRLKAEATDKLHAGSTVASRARRAVFNASESGRLNALGENELVEDVESGRVELSDIERELLPESMRAMAPAEQEALLEEKADRRRELTAEIESLARERDSYLRSKVEEAGGAAGSLDDQIYDAVRSQAEKKGLRYEAAAPAY